MMKLSALVLLTALTVIHKAPPCLAAEPEVKPNIALPMLDAHSAHQQTMPMPGAPAPGLLPPQPPAAISKSDGGKRDETIGGLPGAKQEIGEKQP